MQDLKDSKKDPSKDSATKTTYYCTCHAVPRKMVLIPGGYSSYYACENYLEENRLPGEGICLNRLNLVDAGAIFEKVQQLGGDVGEEDGLLLASVFCRKGLKFTYHGIKAEVLRDSLDEIRIGINGKKL